MIDPALSFDRAAEDYELARPGYPMAVLDVLPLRANAEVLDLGAGTGKLTRMLSAHYPHVVAVEPLDGMRAILEQVVPKAESLAGTAESIPVPDASVDGVFAAQAFHWFSNDEAVAEIARVLRPGGVLCVLWNEPGGPPPFPAAYQGYLDKLQAPSLEALRSGPPWTDVLGRGPFGEITSASAAHEQLQDREAALAYARSVSWIARLPDEERAEIMRDLDSLLPEGPFAIPLRTEIKWTVRA